MNRDDFDQFMVVVNTYKLLDEEPRQFLMDLINRELKHKVLNMTEHDTIHLQMDEHPCWVRLYTWIILAKPHWLIKV